MRYIDGNLNDNKMQLRLKLIKNPFIVIIAASSGWTQRFCVPNAMILNGEFVVGTKEVCLMRVVHSCVVDECMYGYVETGQMQKQTSQKRWVEQFQARRKKITK